MAAFAVLWFLYHWLVKEDLYRFKDEIRTGGFVLAVWGGVWWLLMS
jgi:hypothetical protein